MTRTFSALITATVSALSLAYATDGPDGPAEVTAERGRARILDVVLPTVLDLCREEPSREAVPDPALPTVAGLLTAAAYRQSPYDWWTGLTGGPHPDPETAGRQLLLWCHVAWQLIQTLAALITAKLDPDDHPPAWPS
jgi:hypothetical protein